MCGLKVMVAGFAKLGTCPQKSCFKYSLSVMGSQIKDESVNDTIDVVEELAYSCGAFGYGL